MEIISKGILSDFIFFDYNAVVTDHGPYIQVHTPDNPDFYYGNLLVFPTTPDETTFIDWEKQFENRFAEISGVKHKTFLWDTTDQVSEATKSVFKSLGYEFDTVSVLGSSDPEKPRDCPSDITFRCLETDDDFLQAIETQVRCRDGSFKEQPYRAFKTTQMANYRAMQNDGWGHWYGAFRGDKQVANMGIFQNGKVSRFQSVVTDPDHRRQGICAALVYHVATQTLQNHPENTLVIVAIQGEPAERIYSRLGFSHIETLESACLRPAT